MFQRILLLDRVQSTNTVALEAREDGLVVQAREQSAGRGRRGNAWASARDLGLWCSLCLEGPPQGLTFAAACAIQETLAERVPATVKWPNDVLCAGRKVCGILVEHRNGWSALGFGINVHHRAEDFPPELRETAASLEMLSGRPWDRDALLREVLAQLAPRVDALRAGRHEEVRQEWIEKLDLLGKTIRQSGVTGKVIAIDGEGALNVETPEGVISLTSGGVLEVEERVSRAVGH